MKRLKTRPKKSPLASASHGGHMFLTQPWKLRGNIRAVKRSHSKHRVLRAGSWLLTPSGEWDVLHMVLRGHLVSGRDEKNADAVRANFFPAFLVFGFEQGFYFLNCILLPVFACFCVFLTYFLHPIFLGRNLRPCFPPFFLPLCSLTDTGWQTAQGGGRAGMGLTYTGHWLDTPWTLNETFNLSEGSQN